MDIQETINAIIDKVRWLVRDNEVARKIAAAKDDIKVVLESNESGEFEIKFIKFVGLGGELEVHPQGILLVTNSDIFGTQLFKYENFDELLKLQN